MSNVTEPLKQAAESTSVELINFLRAEATTLDCLDGNSNYDVEVAIYCAAADRLESLQATIERVKLLPDEWKEYSHEITHPVYTLYGIRKIVQGLAEKLDQEIKGE